MENPALFDSAHTFVEVILPLALPKTFTYAVPSELLPQLKMGIRAEVEFGKNKRYTALVVERHDNMPAAYKPKPILAFLDEKPVVTATQIKLWQWMATYYCCTIGDVMSAALPSALKLASETRLAVSPIFDKMQGNVQLSDAEFMVTEALSIQKEITIEDVQKILNKRTVYPVIQKLLDKRILVFKEELQEKYKPKKVTCVRLRAPYNQLSENELGNVLGKMLRGDRHAKAIVAFLELSKNNKNDITRQQIADLAQIESSAIKALEQKNIFEFYEKEVSRIAGYTEDLAEASALSPTQIKVIADIDENFREKNVTLLHGITGSGKTRIYTELINRAIERGEQVLYLLPEIALTTQIVQRLQIVYGDKIAVYHSKLNNNERVEIWKAAMDGKPILLGARSTLFLPFTNLKFIVIDEEHDQSYKQQDPDPRYNARDTAIYLAHLHKAKVLLGTATPSIESYQNAKTKKYGFVKLEERFGGMELPELEIVDIRKEMKNKLLQSHFTSVLIEALKGALERGEQAILFQNRRGYAPTLRCTTCQWHSECIHCDVALTYHKAANNLHCHYCGYHTGLPSECPSCGNRHLTFKGFGTEKIEDELQICLPDARIGRMDLDTVRTKNAHSRLINDFEEKRLDILVGTQMVTKGLDFDNVSIVGVLSADHSLQFPDFRAAERAFQVITQVAGRAGRKNKRGRVIIQTFDPKHIVLKNIVENNYEGFFEREIAEREAFKYPPFYRVIRITLSHKKIEPLNQASRIFGAHLLEHLGRERILGPSLPPVPKLRDYFLMDVLLKLERNVALIDKTKELIIEATALARKHAGCSQIRVNVDVDPY
jgi:primosomal protein N' (replication factor Y) (superfamily II helicase)